MSNSLRAQRLSIAKHRKQKVAALYNDGGYFVYAKALPKLHASSKLIIRLPDKTGVTRTTGGGRAEITLTGAQAKSLKKVLNAI